MKALQTTLDRITDRKDAGFFIGGEWRAGTGGAMLDVVAPHSEDVLLRYREGTPADMDAAVAAAREAFDHGPIDPEDVEALRTMGYVE